MCGGFHEENKKKRLDAVLGVFTSLESSEKINIKTKMNITFFYFVGNCVLMKILIKNREVAFKNEKKNTVQKGEREREKY